MQTRLKEESPSKLGQTIAPKTVKEEINLLRNIFNRALQHEVISKIPVARFPSIKVDNVRKRIFEKEEYRIIRRVPTRGSKGLSSWLEVLGCARTKLFSWSGMM